MTMTVVRTIIIMVLWMSLWRSFSIGTALGGLVVAAVTIVFSSPWKPLRRVPHPIRIVALVAWTLSSIILSSLRIAWRVLHIGDQPTPGTVSVGLQPHGPVDVALISQIVTLSPGTVTIDFNPDEQLLQVHVFDLASSEAVQADIKKLEQLVSRAFITLNIKQLRNQR